VALLTGKSLAPKLSVEDRARVSASLRGSRPGPLEPTVKLWLPIVFAVAGVSGAIASAQMAVHPCDPYRLAGAFATIRALAEAADTPESVRGAAIRVLEVMAEAGVKDPGERRRWRTKRRQKT
jgi:hypothetical protein